MKLKNITGLGVLMISLCTFGESFAVTPLLTVNHLREIPSSIPQTDTTEVAQYQLVRTAAGMVQPVGYQIVLLGAPGVSVASGTNCDTSGGHASIPNGVTSCALNLGFDPTHLPVGAYGYDVAKVGFTGGPVTLSFKTTIIPAPPPAAAGSFSPNPDSFSVQSGASITRQYQLASTGKTPLSYSLAFTGSHEYANFADGGTCSMSGGGTLSPGSTCTFGVTFIAPASTGTFSYGVTANNAVVSNLSITANVSPAPTPAGDFKPNPDNFSVLSSGSITRSYQLESTGQAPLSYSLELKGEHVSFADGGTCSTSGGSTLASGSTCTFNVTFNAPSSTGLFHYSVTANNAVVTDLAATASVSPLPPQAGTFTPPSDKYTVTAGAGTQTSKVYTLTNTSQSPTTLPSALSVSGSEQLQPLQVLNNTCPPVLQVGGHCTFNVQFGVPNTIAAPTDYTYTVNTNAASGAVTPLNTTVTVNPPATTSGSFSPNPDSTTVTATASGIDAHSTTYTLKNTGNQPFAASLVAPTYSGALTSAGLENNQCTGQDLAPNQTCTFGIHYTAANPAQETTGGYSVSVNGVTTAQVPSLSATITIKPFVPPPPESGYFANDNTGTKADGTSFNVDTSSSTHTRLEYLYNPTDSVLTYNSLMIAGNTWPSAAKLTLVSAEDAQQTPECNMGSSGSVTAHSACVFGVQFVPSVLTGGANYPFILSDTSSTTIPSATVTANASSTPPASQMGTPSIDFWMGSSGSNFAFVPVGSSTTPTPDQFTCGTLSQTENDKYCYGAQIQWHMYETKAKPTVWYLYKNGTLVSGAAHNIPDTYVNGAIPVTGDPALGGVHYPFTFALSEGGKISFSVEVCDKDKSAPDAQCAMSQPVKFGVGAPFTGDDTFTVDTAHIDPCLQSWYQAMGAPGQYNPGFKVQNVCSQPAYFLPQTKLVINSSSYQLPTGAGVGMSGNTFLPWIQSTVKDVPPVTVSFDYYQNAITNNNLNAFLDPNQSMTFSINGQGYTTVPANLALTAYDKDIPVIPFDTLSVTSSDFPGGTTPTFPATAYLEVGQPGDGDGPYAFSFPLYWSKTTYIPTNLALLIPPTAAGTPLAIVLSDYQGTDGQWYSATDGSGVVSEYKISPGQSSQQVGYIKNPSDAGLTISTGINDATFAAAQTDKALANDLKNLDLPYNFRVAGGIGNQQASVHHLLLTDGTQARQAATVTGLLESRKFVISTLPENLTDGFNVYPTVTAGSNQYHFYNCTANKSASGSDVWAYPMSFASLTTDPKANSFDVYYDCVSSGRVSSDTVQVTIEGYPTGYTAGLTVKFIDKTHDRAPIDFTVTPQVHSNSGSSVTGQVQLADGEVYGVSSQGIVYNGVYYRPQVSTNFTPKSSGTTVTIQYAAMVPTVGPYIDVTMPLQQATAIPKNLTAMVGAFLIADGNAADPCTPKWGGYSGHPYNDLFQVGKDGSYDETLINFAKVNPQNKYYISFGGANGTMIATTCTSVADLTKTYEAVYNFFNTQTPGQVAGLDFDIEGSALSDSEALARRAAALLQFEKDIPNAQVWLTLPALTRDNTVDSSGQVTGGLTAQGRGIVSQYFNAGVTVGVNIMAMDYASNYVPSVIENMGNAAIQATDILRDQLAVIIFPNDHYTPPSKPGDHITLPDDERGYVNSLIGVTPMLGYNDSGAPEIFYPADAVNLAQYVKTNGIARLAAWSVNRDEVGTAGSSGPTGSGIDIPDFGFITCYIEALSGATQESYCSKSS